MRIRRINVLWLFLIGGMASSYFGKRLAIFFLILWIGVLFLDYLYYRMLPASLPCSLELPATCPKGQEITGYLHVVQNGRLPIFSGEARIHFRSLYYAQEERIALDIALMGGEEGISAFDLKVPYVGMVEVTLEEAEIYDFLGLWKKTILSSVTKNVMVMPDSREICMDLVELGNLDPEGEEIRDAVYGYDPGMYQGIRPYRDGDSMKYIHWKLTGKTGEIMVKELGVPAGKEPRLYLETGLPDLDPERIDRLIEDYFSFSMMLIKQGRPHILCWKNENQAGQEYVVENLTMLEEVLEPLFRIIFWQDSRQSKMDTWIYYMNYDESMIYGFYQEEDYDYLELIKTGERLWNYGR